jgi:hypothetical protein
VHKTHTIQRHSAPITVYFHQGCPVCGRRLEIDVNLLGRRVFCQHCGGGFVAMDPSLSPAPDVRSAATVEKADALLQQAALVLGQAVDGDL